MITEVCRFCRGVNAKTLSINPTTKEAITALMDAFGHVHLVQTPILNKSVSHAKDVAAARDMLQRNEDTFVAELESQFKYSPEHVAAMKPVLQTCECN
jgi:hypothetical protein